MTTLLGAVIFDCDGVLLESADIKTQAFADLFADHPDHVDEIVALHEREGGLSRYVKFDRIHRDLLGLPLTPEHRAWLGEEYSRLVIEKVLACDVVAGVRPLLARLSALDIPMYVASGSPQDELELALNHHGLGPHFEQVWGHPATKPEAIAIVLDRHDLSPRSVPFVGDAWSDYAAAQGGGLPFLGRVPAGRDNPFPDSVIVGADLHALQPHLLERGDTA